MIPIPLEFIRSMARQPVRNYIAPGLSSYIIGAPHEGGCVRLFESEREQQFAITPHSHRFDFHCLVLQGRVTNRLWRKSTAGDDFVETKLIFDSLGKYKRGATEAVRRVSHDTVYSAGQGYAMKAEEVHSIYFGRDTSVLFFEGPNVLNTSVILEPWVDEKAIETFRVEPWMFQKETA
ncbi:hypothetical protein GFK26_18185 [Variovorax paradoxus]|uniref:Uncharacterized protein n=1 Tax=Variovorax paradoxus TaxID=34073 RepID=A0A5Q0M5U7_VARPD|nr:hypothetical protein [Variovorax paradoxus]QFZ84558.1 hypothetical protein GFK26_18185 [Variovorax paradoxus]